MEKYILNKLLLLFVILISNPNLYSQQSIQETGFEQVRASAHFIPGYISVKEDVSIANGISDWGVAFIRAGVGVSFLRYIFVNAGFGVTSFKDEAPISVYVTNTFYGPLLPYDTETNIDAEEFYYNAGIKIPLLRRLHSEISYGKTKFSVKREVAGCDNCPVQDLDVNGGENIQFGLFFQTKKQSFITISYAHFMNDASFDSIISFGFLIGN